jgi:hypothetical protein
MLLLKVRVPPSPHYKGEFEFETLYCILGFMAVIFCYLCSFESFLLESFSITIYTFLMCTETNTVLLDATLGLIDQGTLFRHLVSGKGRTA